MDISGLLDITGDHGAAALAGLAVGAIFGIASQRSRFCLRAATVEFARGQLGPRMAVWLLCFSTAVFWTQAFALDGLVPLEQARVLSAPGSLSGAVLGGLMFGAGMVLARGCAGRLLVLAAGGNLRALLSGLVFAVIAQMSFHGVLAPLRDDLAGLWTTGAANIEWTAWLGLGPYAGLAIGVVLAAVALVTSWRAGVGWPVLVFGSGVGFAVGAGWLLTALIARQAFDPVPVESLTFSGPSADTLMYFMTKAGALDFDVGLIPGVFLGAALAALLAREWRLEGFEGARSMRRYLAGAAMMGFGAMLAGGCAIGAGVTGGSAFSLTAWLALTCMWIGAVATDRLVDRPAEGGAGAPPAGKLQKSL
ncbi:MAG: YeeE/YedE family protein [Kiloniellaceae bacterium]